MTDPIADMLVRVMNGYRAKKPAVVLPYSKMKESIARVLEARGYIAGYEKKGRKIRKFLDITLRYDDGAPALEGVRRVSKASRRLYAGTSEIRRVRQGHGLVIVSTSKGLMSGEDAHKAGVGGELIAEVW